MVVMLVFVLLGAAIAFTFEDGGIRWRAGQKWEAGVQIAVVSPGNDSLANAETRSERIGSALTFSRLLQTNEAVDWVARQNGFEPIEPIRSEVAPGSSLISAYVIAETPEQASAAAVSIFDYLNMQLQQPLLLSELTLPPEEPVIEITGPFSSSMTVNFDEGLAALPPGLFVQVGTDVGSDLTLLVSDFAGRGVSVETMLAPVTTVTVNLQDSLGTVLDQRRLAVPPVSGFSAFYPALEVDLDANAVELDASGEEPIYVLNEASMDVGWVPGSGAPQGAPVIVPVDIALITQEPVAEPTGGRAGPIIVGAFIIVGAILALTVVMVVATWERERLAADHGPGLKVVSDESGPAETYIPDGDHAEVDGAPSEAFARLSLWEASGVESDDT